MFKYAHTILQDPVSVAPWAPHAFEAGELRLQQEGQNHSTVVALHTRPQRLQHTHYSHISTIECSAIYTAIFSDDYYPHNRNLLICDSLALLDPSQPLMEVKKQSSTI